MQEEQEGSTQPGEDPQDAAWRFRALSEAAELLGNAATFYSGRVEQAAIGHQRRVSSPGGPDLPFDEVMMV